MRQYCASAISSSARDRLTTRTHGTVSSAPEAERAMTPLSGGLCRSWVTIAAASNAAAERSTAPILCGSVTWSRTMIGRLLPAPSSSCRIRSEEHTSELQSLIRISYAVFCLKKKKQTNEYLYTLQLCHFCY